MKTILLQSDGRHAKSLWFSVKIGGGKFSIQARLGIFSVTLRRDMKKRIHRQQQKTRRGTTGTALRKYAKMKYSKEFFEKVFSTKRMERYFSLYPDNVDRAMLHHCCNLQLAEAFYISLSVLEVTLRNALCRELETMAGRGDWYAVFPTIPGLVKLNRYAS